MPTKRTPRELLLAALERRRLTGYCASGDAAWVVFPPRRDGDVRFEVIHLPHVRRFRVVSSQTKGAATSPPQTIGNFRSGEAAAECVADALTALASQPAAHLAAVVPVCLAEGHC